MSEQEYMLEDLLQVLSVGDLRLLSAEDKAWLQRLLEHNAEARQCYVAFMDMEGELYFDSLPDLFETTPENDKKEPAKKSPVLGFLGDTARQVSSYLSQPTPLSLFVVGVIMTLGMAWVLSMWAVPDFTWQEPRYARQVDVVEEPAFVARVTGTRFCKWGPDCLVPSGFEELGAGRELEVASGLVEITYESGAKAIVEGPARFTVLKENAGRLDSGKLSAKVPEAAVGFSIQTPNATIVDLGTEFGVVADQRGETEVCVFRGKVEAEWAGQERTRQEKYLLDKGKAAMFNAQSAAVRKLAGDERRFFRELPRRSTIVDMTGAVRLLPVAPPSVALDALEDSGRIFLFSEREGVVLRRDTRVTIAAPGAHASFEGLSTILPAGKRVDSFLLHFDPICENNKAVTLSGSVRFDRPVLGVIAVDAQLAETDADLGALGTKYSKQEGRQMEGRSRGNGKDRLVLSPDRRTLSIEMDTATLDQLRVLVDADAEMHNRGV